MIQAWLVGGDIVMEIIKVESRLLEHGKLYAFHLFSVVWDGLGRVYGGEAEIVDVVQGRLKGKSGIGGSIGQVGEVIV